MQRLLKTKQGLQIVSMSISWFWNCNTVKEHITTGANLANRTGTFSVLFLQLPVVYKYFDIIFKSSLTQFTLYFFFLSSNSKVTLNLL